MIALKPLKFKEPFIFSSERTIQKDLIEIEKKEIENIGILKAPKKSDFYKELFEACMEEYKKEVKENIQFMRTMRVILEKYGYQNM